MPASAPVTEVAGGPSADSLDRTECYENNELVECASVQDLEDLTYLAADILAEVDALQAENEWNDAACEGYNGCYYGDDAAQSDDAFVVSGPAAGEPEFASCRAKLAAAFVTITAAAGHTFLMLDAIALALGETAAMSIMAALGWSLGSVSLITGAGIATALAAVCVVYWFMDDLMVPQRRIADGMI